MSFIAYIQAVLAVLMTFTILLQHRASGLSSSFGGSGESSFVQRRGAELLLYQAGIAFSALFFALTVVDWYL